MIAIDYKCSDGTYASDIFCSKCADTFARASVYDGDPRRPATAKDARERDADAGRERDDYRDVIACDGCGEEEEIP